MVRKLTYPAPSQRVKVTLLITRGITLVATIHHFIYSMMMICWHFHMFCLTARRLHVSANSELLLYYLELQEAQDIMTLVFCAKDKKMYNTMPRMTESQNAVGDVVDDGSVGDWLLAV
jgi:hypothetical protein